MDELDTPRLLIVPLTPAQCRMWLQSPRRLAEALGVRELPTPRGHLREAMRGLFAAGPSFVPSGLSTEAGGARGLVPVRRLGA